MEGEAMMQDGKATGIGGWLMPVWHGFEQHLIVRELVATNGRGADEAAFLVIGPDVHFAEVCSRPSFWTHWTWTALRSTTGWSPSRTNWRWMEM